MSDLAPAVERLVEIALKGGKDKELGPAVHAVMEAFDEGDPRDTKAALRKLDAGLVKATGRGAQVLHLALGALVEAGAPPELAWPAVARGLPAILIGAARYAEACVDAADQPGIDEAIRLAGAGVAKKRPRDAEAFQALASRCLAAVACLSRSSKLRKKARASKELVDAVYPLDEAVEEVTFLSQVVRMLDDAPILVLHPASRRGFRAVAHEVTSNLELFVLLTDQIVGDPTKGFIKGRRPNARAVAALKDPDSAPKTAPEIPVPFNLVAWTGLASDGALPPATDRNHEHWVWLEGVPADIPLFQGERVILLQPNIMARTVEVEPSFSALAPEVRLKGKVSGAEVDRLLAKMGKAAAKAAAAKAPKAAAERAPTAPKKRAATKRTKR
jgi:hypothetical protein